jgi:hypothetical protein
MRILFFHHFQILTQDAFAAHGIHQRDLHPGQLDIGRDKVHPFWAMKDTLQAEPAPCSPSAQFKRASVKTRAIAVC